MLELNLRSRRAVVRPAVNAFELINTSYLGIFNEDGELELNEDLYKMYLDALRDTTRFIPRLETEVVRISLIPGMSSKVIESYRDTVKGLIIEGYGTGGIPGYLYRAIAEIVSNGIPLLVLSQTESRGTDLTEYEVGYRLKSIANCIVYEAYDMTKEAAVIKFMWALAQPDPQLRDEIMLKSYRFESMLLPPA